MILTIAGTSGSGKSHLMRSILEHARKHGKLKEDKDGDKVDGYRLRLPSVKGELYVLGAYDVPTGGCDTTGSAIEVFELLPFLIKKFDHVLYEGLFVMNMTRGPVLAEEHGSDFCVIQLATPLATCVASINARRAERGVGMLTEVSNTKSNYQRANSFCAKMRDAGARVVRVNREDGLPTVLKLLGEKG